MRSLVVAASISASVFAAPSLARAASVEIVVSRQGPNAWNLFVSSLAAPPIGSVALVVSDSLIGFTPSPAYDGGISCAPPIGGDCYVSPISAGLSLFLLQIPSGHAISFMSANVGSFASSVTTPPVVLPGDDYAGGTAFDTFGNPIFNVAIQVLPEPGVSGLLALGCFAIAARVRVKVTE